MKNNYKIVIPCYETLLPTRLQFIFFAAFAAAQPITKPANKKKAITFPSSEASKKGKITYKLIPASYKLMLLCV